MGCKIRRFYQESDQIATHHYILIWYDPQNSSFVILHILLTKNHKKAHQIITYEIEFINSYFHFSQRNQKKRHRIEGLEGPIDVQDDPIIVDLPAELWLHILKLAAEPPSTPRVDLETEEEHRVAFNSAMQLRRVNKLFRLLSRDFQVCISYLLHMRSGAWFN